MPHSVASNSSNDPMDPDGILPDAPTACPKGSDAEDRDDLSGSNIVVKDTSNSNVKLEDLFDEDDDEEFPSSGVSKEDVQSSSPPPSPL